MEDIKKKRRSPDEKEQEIREILAKADEIRLEDLFIDTDGDVLTVDEIKQILAPNDTDDPEEKYRIYYQGVEKLLRSGLPAGKLYEHVRRVVREEVLTFLSRGKTKKSGRRGADPRMGFLTDMNTAYDALIDWTARNGSATDLYDTFRELNKIYKPVADADQS